MSVEAEDGLGEAFEGQVRLWVAIASQVGQVLAQQREQALRRAQQESEREAVELQRRFAAESRAARAELAQVREPQWWDTATPEKIGRAYQVARAWSPHDDEAARIHVHMRDELARRYGVDVDSLNADPALVAEGVRARLAAEQRPVVSPGEAAEAAALVGLARVDEAMADEQRRLSEQERAEALAQDGEGNAHDLDVDQAEQRAAESMEPGEQRIAQEQADVSEHQADEVDREAGRLYDSAERREVDAAELEGRGIDKKVVETRMRADVSQARPATDATKNPARAPRARKGTKRLTSRGKKRELGGR